MNPDTPMIITAQLAQRALAYISQANPPLGMRTHEVVELVDAMRSLRPALEAETGEAKSKPPVGESK